MSNVITVLDSKLILYKLVYTSPYSATLFLDVALLSAALFIASVLTMPACFAMLTCYAY